MAEYLSDEQVSRYGRFSAALSAEDLERFFYLDGAALEVVAKKRGPHNRLGWGVQWGTVRMLGTFLVDPREVPHVAVDYVAEQIGVSDPSCIKQYPDRRQTQHDHAKGIRDLLELRDFASAQLEMLKFIGSRARLFRGSRRELFDRAVVWLIDNKVVLPGITVLERLVRDVRRSELDAINAVLMERTPVGLRRELLETLEVPDGWRVSILEWMRSPVTKLTGLGMSRALERSSTVWAMGTGSVDTTGVAPVKLAELAAYGMTAKAPKIKQLEAQRRAATLLATVRHLEGASVDDALLLFDVLMATKLLSRAARAGRNEKLKTLPKLRKAAGDLAAAVAVVYDTPPPKGSGRRRRRRWSAGSSRSCRKNG